MKTGNRFVQILTIAVLLTLALSTAEAQRFGAMEPGSLGSRFLISNGPKGPIHGGESAVTDLILMDDGWVYGSTGATWGAEACHLFRTDGETSEHVLNVTGKLPGQVKISDLTVGPKNILIGGTTTHNEVFDEKKRYDGGHIFSYDPKTRAFVDYGVISPGQGINCVAVDSLHMRVYCVTYPEGHLFAYNYETKQKKDFGEVMKPWRVKDIGSVSWRGVPKVLMIDDAGTVYYSTYAGQDGGQIFRLTYGDEKPVFTGAVVPTQRGMHNDPIYENTIVSAIKACDGGFWCGSSVDGFLFKFFPSTSTVVNKGKAFNYWNLRSLAYGGDGKLYMLGGRDYDNSWLLCYDPGKGSIDCLGWPTNTTQCGTICADEEGRILMAENLRNSFITVYQKSK
ncbi:hypothetical protein ACFL1R_06205 [Candidatus Latescibacterota bacterium]